LLDACRDAAAEYGIPDLSGASIAAALSDEGSQTAMLALLHPKRDLDVRAAAAGALRLSLGATSCSGRQGATVAPPLSLCIAEVRLVPPAATMLAPCVVQIVQCACRAAWCTLTQCGCCLNA